MWHAPMLRLGGQNWLVSRHVGGTEAEGSDGGAATISETGGTPETAEAMGGGVGGRRMRARGARGQAFGGALGAGRRSTWGAKSARHALQSRHGRKGHPSTPL